MELWSPDTLLAIKTKHIKNATWPERCSHRNEKTRKREHFLPFSRFRVFIFLCSSHLRLSLIASSIDCSVFLLLSAKSAFLLCAFSGFRVVAFSRFRVFDHSLSLTKLYVQGVRGRVRNIHCTGVQLLILVKFILYNFQRGGGSFFW